MQQATLNDIYSMIIPLSQEEKLYLRDMINKQMIESGREDILQSAKKARKNLKEGKIFHGSVSEIKEYLEND